VLRAESSEDAYLSSCGGAWLAALPGFLDRKLQQVPPSYPPNYTTLLLQADSESLKSEVMLTKSDMSSYGLWSWCQSEIDTTAVNEPLPPISTLADFSASTEVGEVTPNIINPDMSPSFPPTNAEDSIPNMVPPASGAWWRPGRMWLTLETHVGMKQEGTGICY